MHKAISASNRLHKISMARTATVINRDAGANGISLHVQNAG